MTFLDINSKDRNAVSSDGNTRINFLTVLRPHLFDVGLRISAISYEQSVSAVLPPFPNPFDKTYVLLSISFLRMQIESYCWSLQVSCWSAPDLIFSSLVSVSEAVFQHLTRADAGGMRSHFGAAKVYVGTKTGHLAVQWPIYLLRFRSL